VPSLPEKTKSSRMPSKQSIDARIDVRKTPVVFGAPRSAANQFGAKSAPIIVSVLR
jgi:hypothetical protein